MSNYIIHYGIKGQSWGVQNGPPYPLGAEQKSVSEKKAAKTINKANRITTRSAANRAMLKTKRHAANRVTAYTIDAGIIALGLGSANPFLAGYGAAWTLADIATDVTRHAIAKNGETRAEKIIKELGDLGVETSKDIGSVTVHDRHGIDYQEEASRYRRK